MAIAAQILKDVESAAREFAGTNQGNLRQAIESGAVSLRELGAAFGQTLEEVLES